MNQVRKRDEQIRSTWTEYFPSGQKARKTTRNGADGEDEDNESEDERAGAKEDDPVRSVESYRYLGLHTTEYTYDEFDRQTSAKESGKDAESSDDAAYRRDRGPQDPEEPKNDFRSYAKDANGSVEGLEGKDGSVPDEMRYEYDPYGALSVNVT